MFKLWLTIKKDVRVLLRDKVGLSLMFAMPIILVIVVTSIQNSTFQLVGKNRLPVLICNNDTGKLSRQMIAAIGDIGMFQVLQAKAGQLYRKTKGFCRIPATRFPFWSRLATLLRVTEPRSERHWITCLGSEFAKGIRLNRG